MKRRKISAFERKTLDYIKKWEARGYENGIPEQAPDLLEEHVKAPSYRAICLGILKNDSYLVSLGYSRPKSGAYMALKRIEIEGREK